MSMSMSMCICVYAYVYVCVYISHKFTDLVVKMCVCALFLLRVLLSTRADICMRTFYIYLYFQILRQLQTIKDIYIYPFLLRCELLKLRTNFKPPTVIDFIYIYSKPDCKSVCLCALYLFTGILTSILILNICPPYIYTLCDFFRCNRVSFVQYVFLLICTRQHTVTCEKTKRVNSKNEEKKNAY